MQECEVTVPSIRSIEGGIVPLENSHELVTDQAGLFQFSGVLDQLRDSAKYLARHAEHDALTIDLMVDQLDVLRERLKGVLKADMAAAIEDIVPRVPRDSATFAAVYFAAAALARWVDTVHQTPQFLLSQDVAVANAVKVTEKVEEVLSAAQESLGGLKVTSGAPMGQYL